MRRITVLTCAQPRHHALVRVLSSVATEVVAVHEGGSSGGPASETMQHYFGFVRAAERRVFGAVEAPASNVTSVEVPKGSLSAQGLPQEAWDSDAFVVFGTSWIKEPLIGGLIDRGAINLHAGLSPYYRGAACNFWALYDGRSELVGTTIHVLSRGLDSGDMIRHARPEPGAHDPFDLGMLGVRAGHDALADLIRSGRLESAPRVRQDRSLELRYTRGADFTDAIAAEFLARLPSPDAIAARLSAQVPPLLS